jgi:hypothetical protein
MTARRTGHSSPGFYEGEASSKRSMTAPDMERPCRYHARVHCIPVLISQLHQHLLAHREHLTRRCQVWTDDLMRQRGWCPEVG